MVYKKKYFKKRWTPRKTTRRRVTRRTSRKRKPGPKTVVYRSVGEYAPDILRCKLVYSDPSFRRTNVGGNNIGWRYQSSAYDPDTLIGGVYMPGYLELAAMYNNVRVSGIAYDISMCNVETFPVQFYVIGTDLDPGFNPGTSVTVPWLANPECKSMILGPIGGQDRGRLKGYLSVATLTDNTSKTDPAFAGSTAGPQPTKMVYLNVGTNAAFVSVTGPTCLIKLTYYCEFYGRKVVPT